MRIEWCVWGKYKRFTTSLAVNQSGGQAVFLTGITNGYSENSRYNLRTDCRLHDCQTADWIMLLSRLSPTLLRLLPAQLFQLLPAREDYGVFHARNKHPRRVQILPAASPN
jgi:hypothetical protein